MINESVAETKKGGVVKEPYEDEDDKDDVAQWGHCYPGGQSELDALPGHGEERARGWRWRRRSGRRDVRS